MRMSCHLTWERVALSFSILDLASGCAPRRADLRVSVTPEPIPILLSNCAGVFAMFPCSREDLGARFTVTVSTNDVGGQGGIRVVVVDAASREPLPNQQASGSGEVEVILGPNESVAQ